MNRDLNKGFKETEILMKEEIKSLKSMVAIAVKTLAHTGITDSFIYIVYKYFGAFLAISLTFAFPGSTSGTGNNCDLIF